MHARSGDDTEVNFDSCMYDNIITSRVACTDV